MAREYGRYGYRRVTALLRMEGWVVNRKRVQRIWRREGLRVPKKQPKRARLWLNDGSCIRLRAEHKDHVWSYDFVHHRSHEGRPYRLLAIVDEYTRECLAIRELAAAVQPTQAPQLVGLSAPRAGSHLDETGYAPLRRLHPALVSTELLR